MPGDRICSPGGGGGGLDPVRRGGRGLIQFAGGQDPLAEGQDLRRKVKKLSFFLSMRIYRDKRKKDITAI